MRLRDLFDQITAQIKKSGSPSARLDTDLIFKYVLECSSVELITKDQQSLETKTIEQIQGFANRRCSGEPIAYITGKKEFFGRPFAVGPGVLVPRPETEHLVEEGLAVIRNKIQPKIADFGSGSGCIGLSILLEIQDAQLVSIEKSAAAAIYLKRNLADYGLADRCVVLEKDVCSLEIFDQFDLIVTNPPYISENDSNVHPWVRLHEPQTALFSPDNGLQDVKKWIAMGSPMLKPGGVMLVEIGSEQGASILDWVRSMYEHLDATLGQDLAGLDRFLKLVNTQN